VDPYHFDLDPDPWIRMGEKRIRIRPKIEENFDFFFSSKISVKAMFFVCYLLAYCSFTKKVNLKKLYCIFGCVFFPTQIRSGSLFLFHDTDPAK